MKYNNFEICENSKKLMIHLINGDKLTFQKKEDEHCVFIREIEEWINVHGHDEFGIEMDISIVRSSILYIQYF